MERVNSLEAMLPGRRTVASVCACACLTIGAAAHATEADWVKVLRSGSVAEQTEWGLRFEHGEGVARDPDRAVALYCNAARRGHPGAQYQLGWLYANGRGVPRDDALAAAWLRLAAKSGDAHARRLLDRVDSADTRSLPLCLGSDGRDLSRGALPGVTGAARRTIEQTVRQMAPGYGLDPDLVIAVIEAESAFNPRAVSPKGAQGLMQLIPDTATRFGVSDAFDPVQNLKGGMAYLRWLLTFFEGDVQLALAGYNAGENAVQRHKGVPPYAETRAYVKRITRSYRNPHHPILARAERGATLLADRGS